MKIKIYVKGPNSTQMALDLEQTATIEEFKQAAEKAFDSLIKKVVFGGTILIDDSKTLQEYGIKNGSFIQFIENSGLRKYENSHWHIPIISIIVVPQDADWKAVKIYYECTLRELKRQIEKAYWNRISLMIFQGSTLKEQDDWRTLIDLEIWHLSVIRIILKLK